MPKTTECVDYWVEIQDDLRSDEPARRNGGALDIMSATWRLKNGSDMSDEDARAAFRALINDAMASPEDQSHALLNRDNWWYSEELDASWFRWTTGDGTTVDFVMTRSIADADGHDYDFHLLRI